MGNQLISLCPTEFYEDEGFDNNYEVDEQNHIGAGKFSTVHLCWRRNQPHKRYALKVINTCVGDVASMNRINEEIKILQMLGNHPAIIQLIDVDESLPNSIRIVMELCEGGELYDRIQQKQYYPEAEAKVCCRNLLDAVAYIHSKGIMHRDLKPENILLASKVSNTDIKISDFGLAKMSRDYPRRLPRSHSICGSDFYLAPEVIKQEEYGREIDIWAVGVICYVLLSGSLPFFHNTLHKLYRQIVERDLSFPEQAWKSVSKGALDFILRLLQVRAGDRLTADQALSHPWLRGANSMSFNGPGSFTDANNMARSNSNANYFNMNPRSNSNSAQPNPLAQAHKVGSHSKQAPLSGQRTVSPSPYIVPPGSQASLSQPIGGPMVGGNYYGMQPQYAAPPMNYR